MALKYNTDMERLLVAIMESDHEALGGLIIRLRAELNSLIADYILEVSSLGEYDVAKFNDLTDQLEGDIMVVLAPLLTEYIELAENAHREAVQAVLGQDFELSAITGVGLLDISGSIDQAREKTYSIIAAMISEIEGIASMGVKDGFKAKDIQLLTDKKDSLLYQLRRHFEAFLSLVVNQGVTQASPLKGYTRWYWQIHPELTRSGTCQVCRDYSHGGQNRDGVYTIFDLPMIPVHPHCVCVLIPVE